MLLLFAPRVRQYRSLFFFIYIFYITKERKRHCHKVNITAFFIHLSRSIVFRTFSWACRKIYIMNGIFHIHFSHFTFTQQLRQSILFADCNLWSHFLSISYSRWKQCSYDAQLFQLFPAKLDRKWLEITQCFAFLFFRSAFLSANWKERQDKTKLTKINTTIVLDMRNLFFFKFPKRSRGLKRENEKDRYKEKSKL